MYSFLQQLPFVVVLTFILYIWHIYIDDHLLKAFWVANMLKLDPISQSIKKIQVKDGPSTNPPLQLTNTSTLTESPITILHFLGKYPDLYGFSEGQQGLGNLTFYNKNPYIQACKISRLSYLCFADVIRGWKEEHWDRGCNLLKTTYWACGEGMQWTGRFMVQHSVS